MFTSIVIGNKFTTIKRDWIYTPRGYSAWSAQGANEEEPLPQRAIWVFAGTSDGNDLAQLISKEGYRVVLSTATNYGAQVAHKSCPDVRVISGRMGMEARRQDISDSKAKLIVDATHPYAVKISEQLMEIAQELKIPYLRFERPTESIEGHIELSNSMETAAHRAVEIGQRIFISTGSRDLATFLRIPGAEQKTWFTRITPEAEFLQKALALGIPQSNICAMQGPFSQEFNEALWRDWKIDCVITKESGAPGGYRAKVAAANKLNIPIIVVRRPYIHYPAVVSHFSEVLSHINQVGAKR
jgi:precorrin-3B C17-methyltransferase